MVSSGGGAFLEGVEDVDAEGVEGDKRLGGGPPAGRGAAAGSNLAPVFGTESVIGVPSDITTVVALAGGCGAGKPGRPT